MFGGNAVKGFLAVSGLLLMFFVASTGGSRDVQAAEDAGAFLVSFGQDAAEQLNDPNLSEDERAARFRELLNEAVDLEAIVKFVLGRHWRAASEQERADFEEVFEEIALQRFLPMFTQSDSEYRGESFDILEQRPSTHAEDQVFVHTQVQRPEGPPVVLIWRVRERDGGFKVLDVSVEGISMALTLREEYGSVIRQQGGVGPLVALLRDKLAAGAYAPDAGDGAE